MFKFLTIIALIASIGQSNASFLRELVSGAAGHLFNVSIIHVENKSGHPIRVGTSEQGQGFPERVGTLLIKSFTGGYKVIRPGDNPVYEVDKNSGFFTVAAQYDSGLNPLFTYCVIDTAKASHTLVFRSDGIAGRLYCYDETR